MTIGFDLGDAGSYRLVAHNGRLFLDSHAADAQTVLSTDADTLLALLHGKLNPGTTIISGRARLEGDPELAGRLLAFLGRQASPVG
ncbi:MAG: SCP2 sterol-binding domain-containing protein [Kineosporiaceae bacterium]